jgi:putative sterol carrier protein
VQAGLDGLAELSPAQATDYFAEVDAATLVGAVNAASDDELLHLIRVEHLRSAAVAGILARLEEYAIPERLAQVHGTVRFDLARKEQVLESHLVRLSRGTVSPVDAGEPDVVLRTSPLRFLRMVSGDLNAGLEYLSGRLDITGDAMLALAVGGVFRVPGQQHVAVDPTALDPVDVATALRVATGDHVRKVMTSGFRPVVIEEIFRRMPEFLDARKAERVRLVIGFRLLGNPGGEAERYVVRVDRGVCTVQAGDAGGEDRDATVTCEGHDFLRLATGQLSPITGVLRGVLKVKGDKARALQFSSLMKIPRAAA